MCRCIENDCRRLEVCCSRYMFFFVFSGKATYMQFFCRYSVHIQTVCWAPHVQASHLNVTTPTWTLWWHPYVVKLTWQMTSTSLNVTSMYAQMLLYTGKMKWVCCCTQLNFQQILMPFCWRPTGQLTITQIPMRNEKFKKQKWIEKFNLFYLTKHNQLYGALTNIQLSVILSFTIYFCKWKIIAAIFAINCFGMLQ